MTLKQTSNRGFSLIELIGVLAIISIIASFTIPNLIKRIDLANSDKEAAQLVMLAEELEQSITKSFSLPDATSWVAAIAAVSSMPGDSVQFNEHGFARGFYVDPQFFTSTDTVFPGYIQDEGLLSPPVSPRLMFISNLKGALPEAPTTSAEFDAIWSQTATASLVESDDIKIHRLYLGHLFHQILLLNNSDNEPAYQLSNGQTHPVPALDNDVSGQLSIFVIHRTQLSLYQDSYPSGDLQYTLFIQDQDSFLYGTDDDNWFWGRP